MGIEQRSDFVCLSHLIFVIKVFWALALTFTTQLSNISEKIATFTFFIAFILWIFSWISDRFPRVGIDNGITAVTLLTAHNIILVFLKCKWESQIAFLVTFYGEILLWGAWLLLTIPQNPPERLYIALGRV